MPAIEQSIFHKPFHAKSSKLSGTCWLKRRKNNLGIAHLPLLRDLASSCRAETLAGCRGTHGFPSHREKPLAQSEFASKIWIAELHTTSTNEQSCIVDTVGHSLLKRMIALPFAWIIPHNPRRIPHHHDRGAFSYSPMPAFLLAYLLTYLLLHLHFHMQLEPSSYLFQHDKLRSWDAAEDQPPPHTLIVCTYPLSYYLPIWPIYPSTYPPIYLSTYLSIHPTRYQECLKYTPYLTSRMYQISKTKRRTYGIHTLSTCMTGTGYTVCMTVAQSCRRLWSSEQFNISIYISIIILRHW